MPFETALLATALIGSGYASPPAILVQSSARPMPAVALDMPVTLDEVLLGELVARVRGDEVAVKPIDIVNLIGDRLDPAVRDATLAVTVDEEGYAALRALADAGLEVKYEAESLSLQVLLAASQRGVREISIRNQSKINPQDSIAPAELSAGVTTIVRTAHIHAQPNGGSEFEPVRADLFGFVSFGGFDGWTLTWEADLDTDRRALFRRRNVALTKDNFEDATRLTIGDFRSRPLFGSQRSVNFAGVSFRRAYQEIQPFRSLRPSGRQSFTLERRSRVTVEVDGLIVFDQQLDPGAYDLSDFPLANGSNEAIIRVDDGAGPREIAFFSAFIDNDLLAEGLTRFDINAGFLSNGFSGSPRYTDEPAFSASIERGIATNLTLGAHIEASLDLVHFGARGVVGTPIGLIAAEASASRSEDGWGASAAVQYRNQFETGALLHDVALQASWRNDRIRTLGGPEFQELSFDLRWLVQTKAAQLTVSASHTELKDTQTSSLGLGASWRLLNLNWSARGQVLKRTGRQDDYRATLSVSIPLGRRLSARARASTNGEARFELQKLGGFSVGESQFRAQISRDKDGFVGGGGQFRHISNRAEFLFDHQSVQTPNGARSRSEVTAAFGIGYAGGLLQFGRPFDSGFVIVKRHETIERKRASMTEGGVGVSARSDIFGAPLIPLRSSYSNTAYTVEVEEIEPGYDLGVDRIDVLPSFRSGYRVDIGTDLKATVLGRLELASGEPVGLATGRVFNGQDEEVSRFFTNRTGRFVAENLLPGEYVVGIDGQSDVQATFTVSEDEAGIVQIGKLTMEPRI